MGRKRLREPKKLSLIEAAAAAHLDYHTMLRLVCRGVVVGSRDARTRRWTVDPGSLETFLRARERTGDAVAQDGAEPAPGTALGEELDRLLKQRVIDSQVGAATAYPSDAVALVATELAVADRVEDFRKLCARFGGAEKVRAAVEALFRRHDVQLDK